MDNNKTDMELSNNKIILVSAVLILAAGFGGYYVGYKQGNTGPTAEVERYKKAVERLVPPVPAEVTSVSGAVKEIGNGFIIIESSSLAALVLPGEEPKMETRKITIDDKTEFVKVDLSVLPTFADLQKGILRAETKIKLSDIKAGDSVTVDAGENIKTKLDFTAKKITLLVRALPPAPPSLSR